MLLSKEDMFHSGTATTAGTAANGDTLDFGKHGDDVLCSLYWFCHVKQAAAGNVTVAWQTSDTAAFSSPVTLVEKTATAVPKDGAFAFKNEPLPKGLKRYNRLVVTTAGAATAVNAGIVDGRDEGVPFTGL